MKVRYWSGPLSVAVLSAVFGILAISVAPNAQGVTRSIALGGTSSPQTGAFSPSGDADVTYAEFAGQEDDEGGGPGPYPGVITNRSNSRGNGNGASVSSGK